MPPMLKPAWVLPRSRDIDGGGQVRRLLRELGLATVCESARCPNRGECFGSGTATFLILGEVCTRRCGFCAIAKGAPRPPDPNEPAAVAEAVRRLGLAYAVVTSVTRDDLADGGASQFAATIRAIRASCAATSVEVLVPDFTGRPDALALVLAAGPAVLNHNIETVPRLYKQVRMGARYERSLELLARARTMNPSIPTKSGIMVGLGESNEEVISVLGDMRTHGVEIATIGQYLRPTAMNLPVLRYVTPPEFAEYKRAGMEMGFSHVESGPLVRSSYHAHEAVPV